ncbi:TetR/AcrR family transcriptional regulator [Nocardia sp. NPDC059246]|uniref:TetR/AcrR family transcriptional regulator n=1 Tax=unclassified Nocardia TaxID=2637762 RepID=UPI0036B40543
MSDTAEHAATRPARGTRPANRRDLIVAAATELFYRRGYADVGTGDIADAVAVGPSALYRHFRNKNDLLRAVVAQPIEIVTELLDAARAEPDIDLARTLATAMLGQRAVGVLWHREARHLDPDAKTELRQRARGIGARFADLLRTRTPRLTPARAEIIGWAALSTASSISFHNLELPRQRFVQVLTDMVDAILTADLPVPRPATAPPVGPSAGWSPSRRIAILTAATKLFAEQGFSGVALEDIGAAAGIAGPSVYNHFDSKADILIAVLDQGNHVLRADMYRDLTRATDAADALDRLLTSHTEFAFEQAGLIRLLTSDIDQLPAADRHRMRGVQHEYIAEWVQLVRQVHPGQDELEARLRVQAALSVINDLAATSRLRATPDTPRLTRHLAAALLAPPHG